MKTGRFVRKEHDRSGQALIELAVVLPTFFVLLLGLFNLSIILFGYVNATFACQLGARYASLHSTTSLAPCDSAFIRNLVTSYLWAQPGATVTVVPTWSAGGNTVGSTVRVAVTIVNPIISGLSSTQISVGSSAQRTIER